MLKIKPFLLSLCLSPLSLTAFQLPVYSQTVNRSPSVTTAGGLSGVPNTVVTVTAPNVGAGASGSTTVSAISPAVSGAVSAVINSGTASATTVTLISSAAPLAAITPVALAAAVATVPATGSTVTAGTSNNVASANGPVTVAATAATTTAAATVTITSAGGATTTVTAPTATGTGAITVGGVTVAIAASVNAAGAAQAATAVLLAGGTPAQAAAAGAIAGTGVNVAAAVALVSQLSLLINPVVGSADLRPNLNASLLKSFDSGKNLLLAQGKGGSINPTQLALAINSYNQIVDTSSPEALAELSKSKEFMEIGQTLRKLRAAFGD